MDKILRRLETFRARGSDGQLYSVHGYEHLRRLDVFSAGEDQWEPIGVAEYKLADGRALQAEPDGSLVVADSGVRLERALAATP